MQRGPQCSQSEGGPRANAAGASMIPKQRRPPRPCGGGGLNDPNAKEAPAQP